MIVHHTVHSRRLPWLVAAALILAIAAWALNHHDDAMSLQPSHVPVQKNAFDAPAVFVPQTPTLSLARSRTVGATVPFRCDAQRLEASFNGISAPQCVAAARPIVNGSTRTYRAEARDSGGHWIVIDVAGDAVSGASIGRGDQADYACEADACTDIALGPLDQQGSRTITLSGVRLAPSGAATAAEKGAVAILDGRLTTAMADMASASAACADQSLLVSVQGAPTQRFCPDDGIAIDNAQPQGPLYSFNSIDGIGIAVALDAEGRVRRVDQGAMSCVVPNCAGVAVTPRGADGNRRIVFNGALLQDPARPEHWAGLSGSLPLP